MAASALLSGRAAARPADLWVMRYLWDREEQIDPLAALVGGVLERAAADEPDVPRHPLADPPDRVDAEDLARQLDDVDRQLRDPAGRSATLNLTAAARLRDRLAELADRAAWVADEAERAHLGRRAAELMERVG